MTPPYNLRPSSSGTWSKCAANPRISSAVMREEPESDAAREGTCAAWVADCVLKGEYRTCLIMLGMEHTNGWIVDDEMVYFVEGYVEAVRARGGTINAEQYVRLTEYIAGTFDSSTVSWDETTLNVDDLKYGRKLVDVWENTQTIIYGYAELMRLRNPNITTVRLGIYQPRVWHPEGIHRTWSMSVNELHKLASAIAEAGNKCQEPEASATPGGHCEYCKGRLECEALARTNYAFHDVIEARGQGVMNAEEMSNELTFLERAEALLKARKTAVHAEAEYRINKGEFVRGWGMKERKGNRKFTVDLTTVQLLTGVSPYDRVEMTPAQLEQAGANKKIVSKISMTPTVGHKLDHITERDFGRMFRDQ